MKIGILTLPLHTNYGGILQAYALQKVLKDMGHKVWTIDRESKTSCLIKLLSIVKRILYRIFKREKNRIRVWPTIKEERIILKNTNRFIKENINATPKILSNHDFYLLEKYHFDSIVVGSDQVWRPTYSPCLSNYFLDFAKQWKKIKRIAYAASFGVDNWEFSKDQTIKCASLAQCFDAISVREDSAINLCKEYLDVDAIHVLDPTMLLTKEDYIRLVEKDNIPKSKGSLMTYVLDQSPEKEDIVQNIAKELNLIPFSVMPENTYSEVGNKHISTCIYPTVTEWIRGFMDAEYVVTDSFHGTVFSIIFNKPFITIGNHYRGMTRFTSLLKIFGLQERLIASSEELTEEKMNTPINFTRINQIKESEQKKSMEFLNNELSN